MKSGVLLPPNSYIDYFDFALVFDLPYSKIHISLSPSIIKDPSGITGVKAEIKHFKKTIFAEQYIYTSPNFSDPFSLPLPKVGSSPMWGVYQVTLTLVLTDGHEFKSVKTFNLCPANDQNAKESSLTSELSLSVDCIEGMIHLVDFVCRLYRGKLPSRMAYNLTHWFPPESQLSPVKNINSLPYSNVAYNGNNKISGYNDSIYSFDDNISVIIRITGSIEKNVRCIPDFTSIYCGMRSMYDHAKACMMQPEEMAKKFNEAEMLLWAITVGYQKGNDISDNILRLEQILGVSCVCHGCDGEKVGAAPGCAMVSQLQASNTNGHIAVQFYAGDVPVGSVIHASAAPYCDKELNFIDVMPDKVTSGLVMDTIEFNVRYGGRYRVRITTMVDGRNCGTQEVDTGVSQSCPMITDINGQSVNTGLRSKRIAVKS
jgi:hypothetical protein